LTDTSLYRKVGDVSLPIEEADLTANNVFPDPARDTMLALFQSAINAELATPWAAAVNGTEMEGSDPVQQVLPLEPSSAMLRQWKAGWPLLCLHRVGEAEYAERTLSIDQRTQNWELHYIMDALAIDHIHRVQAVADVWVPTIISQTIERQGHPQYESGAVQFGTGKGGLARVWLRSITVGQATFAQGDGAPIHLMCTMGIETLELASDADGAFADLEGASIGVGVGGPEGILPDVINVDTNHIPPVG
jgi:hypothetical protein